MFVQSTCLPFLFMYYFTVLPTKLCIVAIAICEPFTDSWWLLMWFWRPFERETWMNRDIEIRAMYFSNIGIKIWKSNFHIEKVDVQTKSMLFAFVFCFSIISRFIAIIRILSVEHFKRRLLGSGNGQRMFDISFTFWLKATNMKWTTLNHEKLSAVALLEWNKIKKTTHKS